MIIPKKLEIGDKIGIVAPSGPIIKENIEELERAKIKVEKMGFKVKYSKNLFSNSNIYSAKPEEKAQDINDMFKDKEIKMIWCAKGGFNSNTIFEYLDYELIKNNSKIICGYSDITSIINIINEKTGLVTFSGTNFKTIATDETDYSFNEIIERFVNGSLELKNDEPYETINEGSAEGILIGGNLSLIKNLISGKYSVNFKDKILFIEDLGIETNPAFISNYLYYMKQNDIFKNIKGLWIGNYEHESNIKLEQIVLDVLENKYEFPIIKSNNFGHVETKTVIPIGTKAKIDTKEKNKIILTQKCVK